MERSRKQPNASYWGWPPLTSNPKSSREEQTSMLLNSKWLTVGVRLQWTTVTETRSLQRPFQLPFSRSHEVSPWPQPGSQHGRSSVTSWARGKCMWTGALLGLDKVQLSITFSKFKSIIVSIKKSSNTHTFKDHRIWERHRNPKLYSVKMVCVWSVLLRENAGKGSEINHSPLSNRALSLALSSIFAPIFSPLLSPPITRRLWTTHRWNYGRLYNWAYLSDSCEGWGIRPSKATIFPPLHRVTWI